MAKDCNMSTRCSNCQRNSYSWKEYLSIKYVKYNEKGHVVRNCISEKINWMEDIVELFQILKRSTKQTKDIELAVSLKQVTFRHPIE